MICYCLDVLMARGNNNTWCFDNETILMYLENIVNHLAEFTSASNRLLGYIRPLDYIQQQARYKKETREIFAPATPHNRRRECLNHKTPNLIPRDPLRLVIVILP